MTKKAGAVVVDQAVHGYSDGHRLLSASRQFAQSSERLLRTLSDLSGPSAYSSFGDYYTAYPLHDDRSFAIGRTWIASEMRRPGCVWTHTLVVRNEDLSYLGSVLRLLPLFVRPSLADLGDYARRLTLSPRHTAQARISLEGPEPSLVRRMIESFYTTDEPIYIVSEQPTGYASLVFALWSQYLAVTASAFSFCTGAIRSRKLGTVPLDVQVIPQETTREIIRSHPSAVVLEEHIERHTEQCPEWVHEMASDTIRVGDSPMRAFLADHLVEKQHRASIGRLARLYASVIRVGSGKTDIRVLAKEVAGEYPAAADGSSVKEALFGDKGRRTHLTELNDSALLKALTDTQWFTAFDLRGLRIAERLKKCWTDDRGDTIEVLSRLAALDSDEHRDVVREVLSVSVTLGDVSDLLGFDEKMVMKVMRERRDLASAAAVWKSVDPATLIEALVANDEHLPLRASDAIVTAQLEAGVSDVARPMASWLNGAVVPPVLNWVKQQRTPELNDEWWNGIKAHPVAVCKWLNDGDVSTRLVVRLAAMLNPRAKAIEECGLDVWRQFGETARSELSGSKLREFQSFVLTIGLDQSQKEAAELVAVSFPDVYHAVMHNALSQRVWRSLVQVLPEGFLWSDSRRLRAGLVEKFAQRRWPAIVFLKAMADPDVLGEVFGTWGWGRKETKFLARVIKCGISDRSVVTEAQKKVLKRWRKSFSVS